MHLPLNAVPAPEENQKASGQFLDSVPVAGALGVKLTRPAQVPSHYASSRRPCVGLGGEDDGAGEEDEEENNLEEAGSGQGRRSEEGGGNGE